MATAAKLGISVQEYAELNGVSKWTVYNEINEGKIPVVQIGRRKIIPRRFAEEQHQRAVERVEGAS